MSLYKTLETISFKFDRYRCPNSIGDVIANYAFRLLKEVAKKTNKNNDFLFSVAHNDRGFDINIVSKKQTKEKDVQESNVCSKCIELIQLKNELTHNTLSLVYVKEKQCALITKSCGNSWLYRCEHSTIKIATDTIEQQISNIFAYLQDNNVLEMNISCCKLSKFTIWEPLPTFSYNEKPDVINHMQTYGIFSKLRTKKKVPCIAYGNITPKGFVEFDLSSHWSFLNGKNIVPTTSWADTQTVGGHAPLSKNKNNRCQFIITYCIDNNSKMIKKSIEVELGKTI